MVGGGKENGGPRQYVALRLRDRQAPVAMYRLCAKSAGVPDRGFRPWTRRSRESRMRCARGALPLLRRRRHDSSLVRASLCFIFW